MTRVPKITRGKLPRLAVLSLRKIEAAGEFGQALTAFVWPSSPL